MKRAIKSFGILFMTALFMAACSNDDNAGDNPQPDSNAYTGTYTGYIGYFNEDNNMENQQGTVTVSHDGNLYSFDFSDDIPDLNGIAMEQRDNILINSDKTIKGVVKIVDNNRKLIIDYKGADARWDAEGIK